MKSTVCTVLDPTPPTLTSARISGFPVFTFGRALWMISLVEEYELNRFTRSAP